MPNTYTLIASSTVGAGGASSINFTSIPSTYTDLSILVSTRIDTGAGGDQIQIAFNGSTSSFTSRLLYGSGTGSPTSADISRYVGSNNTTGSTASSFSSTSIYIPNYTSSSNKSFSSESVQETNATNCYAVINAGLWSNTSSITSITLSPNSGNFVQYTTAYLYGIKNS